MLGSRYAFILSLFFLCINLFYYPSFRPLFFAPYLIIVIYKFPLSQGLLKAIFCGLLIDSLSSLPYFGLTSLCFVLSITLTCTQKYNFFEDKYSTLPLLTAFFSVCYTLIEMGAYALFGGKVSISWRWVFTDVLGGAFFDAVYALVFFVIPFRLSKKFQKRWRRKWRKRSL